MNKASKFTIGILIILIIVLGYFLLKNSNVERVESENNTVVEIPVLSESQALNLVKDDLMGGECSKERIYGSYVSCSVYLSKTHNGYMVQVTYMGLYDDSVVASRIEVNLVYSDGVWLKGQTVKTHKCHEGRGHQDFSAEFCT